MNIFRVLRATPFSLRLWLVRPREGRGYAPTSVMVLTVLPIDLFKVEKISVAFFTCQVYFPPAFVVAFPLSPGYLVAKASIHVPRNQIELLV